MGKMFGLQGFQRSLCMGNPVQTLRSYQCQEKLLVLGNHCNYSVLVRQLCHLTVLSLLGRKSKLITCAATSQLIFQKWNCQVEGLGYLKMLVILPNCGPRRLRHFSLSLDCPRVSGFLFTSFKTCHKNKSLLVSLWSLLLELHFAFPQHQSVSFLWLLICTFSQLTRLSASSTSSTHLLPYLRMETQVDWNC